MLTIFRVTNFSFSLIDEAFSACGAKSLCVVLNHLEEGVDGFVVEAIDSLFTFAFEVDEVALKQRLQVMAYHALFLPESFGELVYAERFLSELL